MSKVKSDDMFLTFLQSRAHILRNLNKKFSPWPNIYKKTYTFIRKYYHAILIQTILTLWRLTTTIVVVPQH
jgi:hypothetical protein